MHPFLTLGNLVPLATAVVGAELIPDGAAQLVGRWEAVGLVSTNFDVFRDVTNLALCVYSVNLTTNLQSKSTEAWLKAELQVKSSNDPAGRERIAPDTHDIAWMTPQGIEFGGPHGFVLHYALTNGMLILEKHVAGPTNGATVFRLDFVAKLKKTTTNPGEPLLNWQR